MAARQPALALAEALRDKVKRHGWDVAMKWLDSQRCAAPREVKDAAREALARENIDRVTISERDLTGNRRRPGAWS